MEIQAEIEENMKLGNEYSELDYDYCGRKQ